MRAFAWCDGCAPRSLAQGRWGHAPTATAGRPTGTKVAKEELNDENSAHIREQRRDQYAEMAFGPCIRGRGDVQSRPPEQFIYSDPDISSDPSEKERRNITAAVDRNCRASAILVLKLFMRSTLANFPKLQSFKQGDDFARAKDWNSAHAYGTNTCWMPTNSASR